MKTLYFLGGLPRSGSTLLGSLLNQHPDIYVSPTSPLGDVVTDIEKSFNRVDEQFTFDRKQYLIMSISQFLLTSTITLQNQQS